MKKSILYSGTLLLMAILINCRQEAPKDQGSSTKGRDLFGYNATRGVIKNTEGLSEGYIMFATPNSPYTYLINRMGEVVHQWKCSYSSFNPYLMDDGTLFLGVNDPDYPVFGFGGPYGRIQKISWDGKILWDFEQADEDEILHHDFAVLPNGNILALVYVATSYEQAISNGRKPEMIPKNGPWMEKIIEFVPEGSRHARIVWEWQIGNHLIQDFDESKANFGDPQAHPELLDFNVGHPIPEPITQDSLNVLKAMGIAERNQTVDNMGSDIYHLNALNYNPRLDQIAFSSPTLSEIFFIDHSTTTEEAAGHKGGKSGMGGDFLYRWGNPQNYRMGDSTNRQLFGQHDVRWIEPGKPGAGNLTIFNNHPPGDVEFATMSTSTNYSTVVEIIPPPYQNGRYLREEGQPFGPEKPVWTYMAPDTTSFYSPFVSGAHRMDNGNTLITEGAKGRIFEVTPDNKVVWEYLNPYRGDIRKPNGDPTNHMDAPFFEFRATFIPANHPALEGKELKPLDTQPEVWTMPPMPDAVAGEK